METVRTPDERFEKLPGYDFAPHYTDVPDGEGGTLRIHHVDEGPRDGEPILCMHGQPSWSYLYRKMIPILAEAGHRVLAPDLVGFGRSDKPTRREDYTYANHVAWMNAWVEANDLRDLTLVCQDWGGLIGLRVATDQPDRFARIVVANTGLPDGTGTNIPDDAGPAMRKLYESLPVVKASELGARFAAKEGPPGFLYWRKYCAESPEFSVSDVMRMIAGAGADEIAAYQAPFPDPRYEAGARQFPSLVPIFPDDPEIPNNRKAWEVLRAWRKPFLTAFSDGDPVTAGGEKRFQQEVPGAKGREHPTIRGAGHFLQDEKGPELAAEVLRFIARNPG
ncbi:MAG: haloalkane dehalogenase [Myxococcota bacterium]